MTDKLQQTYTLAEIAARWGCSHSTVLSHVYTGELRALDISTNRRQRSRYIVPGDALAEFEQSRATPPPEPPPKRKRVKVRQGEVIEFFS
jgi:hypothetical protein